MRIGVETLRHPYWYAAQGHQAEAEQFWDKAHWDRVLRNWAAEGYNYVLYWVEPWNKHAWQTFLIRHADHPEARELTAAQSDKLIKHVAWIFGRARELGLKNLLFSYFIVTTPAFAKAHGLDRELPVSPAVDFRHNLKDMGYHFGVRNEATRKFTEAALAELFKTYKDLDGLYGAMGEAVPGKRSTWYREAVVPGLKRSGRNPLFLASSWMQPLDDFLEDMAPKEVYGRTWLAVHSNAEVFTDAKVYPTYARWLERAAVPAVVEVMHHNFEAGFPFNSPRLAWEVIRECRRFEHCDGVLAWFSIDHSDSLMRRALAYYARNDVPYSDEPWLEVLQERYGDRDAARHFLNAYNASARITPEVGALAWVPHDLSVSRQLTLPYWYWTEADTRWSYHASPSRGGVLLPLRYYAKVVAQFGEQFRDNSGADGTRNRDHPGAQELIWGLGDYPVTPEAHMRHVRRLGRECLKEAEQALQKVKKNKEEATAVYNYMKAYKLLSDYYERKVLAATAALIFGFGGPQSSKREAEKFADEAVECYERALNFVWEAIDRKSGKIKGRWLGGKALTLPELIEREKRERESLPALFAWSGRPRPDAGTGPKSGTGPRYGSYAPSGR
ncbi:MAG: hypothetical protein HYS12_11085 [Planctomycetes bacterium]|nr:hypothetical protein [Planctomycetota bacterium]